MVRELINGEFYYAEKDIVEKLSAVRRDLSAMIHSRLLLVGKEEDDDLHDDIDHLDEEDSEDDYYTGYLDGFEDYTTELEFILNTHFRRPLSILKNIDDSQKVTGQMGAIDLNDLNNLHRKVK